MHGSSQYLHCTRRCNYEKLDLSLDANGQKRNREEIRKLLQMRNCSRIRDVSVEANKVRNALCEKLWLEKEIGKVC